MSLAEALLERAAIYRLWQAPFAERKLVPIVASGDVARARRVLDVACGPGTNAARFSHVDYVGVDINDAYIAAARRRHRGRFITADLTAPVQADLGKFDFILVNSFLHHLDTADSIRVLESVRSLLAPGGHVHVLDLVLPERASLARYLALADRGRFARPVDEWRAIFGRVFETVSFARYDLSVLGVPFWEMVYFKGASPA